MANINFFKKLSPLIFLSVVGTALATDAIKICVAENNSPYSYPQKNKITGFDVTLAQQLAAFLGRELVLVPYESKLEGESTLSQEVNAILTSGVCDLSLGFPLIQADLGAPTRKTAKTPDYPGAQRRPKRPWVELSELINSNGYMSMSLVIAVKNPQLNSINFSEPDDIRFGAVSGTVGSAFLLTYKNGVLRKRTKSLSQIESVFPYLERNEIDAAIVPSGQYDSWKIDHPGSQVSRSSALIPLKINLGIVAVKANSHLMNSVNLFIAQSLKDKALSNWAESAHLTWFSPVEPTVSGGISIYDLSR